MIRIGRAEVEVKEGDIVRTDADAVICPANNYLWMGSGIAGRLKKHGGPEVETEAVAQGPIDIGAAVVTTGGTLTCRNVIHVAVMDQGLKAEAAAVSAATTNALAAAEELNLSSLALPDIGASDGGLEVHVCARNVIDAVIDHLLQTAVIDRVSFILEEDEVYKAFHDHLLGRFSAGN